MCDNGCAGHGDDTDILWNSAGDLLGTAAATEVIGTCGGLQTTVVPEPCGSPSSASELV